MQHRNGFSLIEVLVVVVILGVLAAFIVPNVIGQDDKARLVKARQDIRTLSAALKQYRLDNYNYPSTEQGLEALVRKPEGNPPADNWHTGGYIERLMEDPWGRPYIYLQPGLRSDFDVYTLGADGVEGGDGINADLGNWGDGR